MTQENQEHLQKLTTSTTGCPNGPSATANGRAAIINGTAAGSIAYTTIDSSSRTSKKRTRGCSTCTGTTSRIANCC